MRLHRDSDFRREIHTLLSRGESVYQLQRAVYTGKLAPERGRRRDEMKAISVSHALLTNIVLAWNTTRMNDEVERMRWEGIDIDNVPSSAAPCARRGRSHIQGRQPPVALRTFGQILTMAEPNLCLKSSRSRVIP